MIDIIYISKAELWISQNAKVHNKYAAQEAMSSLWNTEMIKYRNFIM